MQQETMSRVREAYRQHGGNLDAVARDLGLSKEECRKAFPQTLAMRPVEDPQPGRDKNGHFDVGRKSLRPKIVSVRHAQAGSWPEADRQALTRAKRSYDAGTHILTQGRDGQWIILYAIKRRKPIPPFNYFYGHFG